MISYYMTVKNGLPHLKEAVQSILSQSVNSWELVVVDDGSNDGTKEYLLGIEKNDSRIKVAITDGIGRGKALNLAVSMTSYEIISNIDADDIINKDKTLLYQRVFEIFPEVNFLCSKALVFTRDASSVINLDCSDDAVERQVSDITTSLVFKSYIEHSSVAMIKKVFLSIGGYNEQRYMQIDYDLWFRWVLSGCKINRLNITLVGKRVHEFQSFESRKRVKYLLSAYQLKKKFLNQYSAPFRYKVYSLFFFLYGFLPRSLRKNIKKLMR